MLGWLVLGLLTAGALALVLLPITLSGHGQLRGEPNGDWAVAGGLGFGPIAASCVAAPGVAPFALLHLFGRKLAAFPLKSALGRVRVFAKHGAELTSLERSVRDVERAGEVFERLVALAQSDHRFRIQSLLFALDYSFQDVALTGRLLGAVYALAAMLPERIAIRQTARWDAEDRFTIEADLRLRIWPGRLGFDALKFMLKRRGPTPATEP